MADKEIMTKCPFADQELADVLAIGNMIIKVKADLEKQILTINGTLSEHAGRLENHNKKLNYIFGTVILTLLSVLGAVSAAVFKFMLKG